jgi:Protein of unknown function (DUF3833)
MMTRQRWIARLRSFSTALLLPLGLLGAAQLTGCAAPQPAEYANATPKLDIKKYFDGHVRGWGMVQDRSGKVLRRFVVDIDARWETKEGRPYGTLDERFVWSDGEQQKRVWQITEESPGQYRGEAGDVIGGASGTSAGNTLNWAYFLRIPYGDTTLDVRMDDWMILVDESTLLNRADMRFWGVRVGELTIAFRRD